MMMMMHRAATPSKPTQTTKLQIHSFIRRKAGPYAGGGALGAYEPPPKK